MTTNTPTPASDLDARVSALMRPIRLMLRHWPTTTQERREADLADLEQAIRAELQKPALQTKVAMPTREEIGRLMLEASTGFHGRVAQIIVDEWAKIAEKTLQGRAKPALQANAAAVEPVGRVYRCEDKTRVVWGNLPIMNTWADLYLGTPPVPTRAQEEITDAEIVKLADHVVLTVHHPDDGKQGWQFSKAKLLAFVAAIRAAQKG